MTAEPKNCTRRSASFTLTEILVVIFILGALTALILPCLYQSQEQAKMAKCVSNLRQLTAMMIQYAVDNKGTVPSVGSAYVLDPDSTNLTAVCHFPPGFPCNLHTLLIDASAVPAHLAHGDHLGACNASDYEECGGLMLSNVWNYNTVFTTPNCFLLVCPSDPNPQVVSFTDSSGNNTLVKVSYNENLEFSFTDPRIFPLPHPGDVILFFDGNPFNVVGAYDVNLYNSQYASFRHRNRANVAYVDGHIGTLSQIPTSQILLH